MAAYAATVSLMHIIDMIKNHPSPPISLDKQQLHSLTEIVTFLREFLENYVSPFSYGDEADPLEIRIAEAVYAAEDVIESYVVDNIYLAAASTTHADDNDGELMESYIVDKIHLAAGASHDDDDDDDYDDDDEQIQNFNFYEGMQRVIEAINMMKKEAIEVDDATESYTVDNIQLDATAATTTAHYEDEQIRYFNFYQGLQNVIEAMYMIKKEAMEMEMVKEKGGLSKSELQRNVSVDAGFKSKSIEKKIEMVGFDDERLELLDRLTGRDSNRQIIPIVGMGGIGKTTLARNVFANQLIKEHFDVCVWTTISQDYNVEQTLNEVMSQGKLDSSGLSVGELGEKLYKYLFGVRYLVVMDDMWSIEVWDKIRNFFPDCSKRSRIIVTTRMSNLAAQLSNSDNSLCMSFLNEFDSWTLFSKTVFGEEINFPVHLREIGKEIVEKCKGLPLCIAVIGGLLAESERTQGHWMYIEENLSSIVNLENEEYCLRVLKLSYNHLPAYLKPCFLYMGMFDEDSEIKVSTILNLWVSEGFLKPKKKQNLETVARQYFQELVDRNLVSTNDEEGSHWCFSSKDRELGSVGMKSMCKMHDLVRDLSLREAQKQRFYHKYSEHDPSSRSHRHIVIPNKTATHIAHGSRIMLESSPNLRSYVCHDDNAFSLPNFRLLRTLHTTCHGDHEYSQNDVFGLVNSRLLAIAVEQDRWLHPSISRLWNLHTLIVNSRNDLEGPVEFWNMSQLKHVEFTGKRLRLRLPLNNDTIVILENLHTLIGMVDFYLNEDVATRIPNLGILDVCYEKKLVSREEHCLSYLQRFSKLESFRCSIEYDSGENLQRICFPQSLKQIILVDDYHHQIELEDVLQKIGRLPFLEELCMKSGFFGRGEWETTQGQFPRLKTLELMCSGDLRKWTVLEASHFPLLQTLRLGSLIALEEIPSEIGEIATLELIVVHHCSRSVVLSAKRIVEEQEDLYGDEELSFCVLVTGIDGELLKSSTSPNLIVKLY